MAEKAYVITDLGPGDGGKGGIVESVAHKVHARVILKEGGAQGSHGVVLSDGRKFNFSQWGCATFQGTPSYLTSRFVMSPIGLLHEAAALQEVGVANAFDLLSVSPYCVCATPYHQVWSHLYEIALRDHPHGTVGTGVGKAFQMSQSDPDLTIHADMLTDKTKVAAVLAKQREFVLNKYSSLTEDDVLPEDREILTRNLEALKNDSAFEDILELMFAAGKNVRLEDMRSVLCQSGNIVVERSHGILTDAEAGLKPHVSSLRTLPKFTDISLRLNGYEGEIMHYGVHRAYSVRHGAGPLPTADPKLLDELLPGSHKDENRWQGQVRVGPLDFVLLNYAINACGGITKFDGICVTWFDQILKCKTWHCCTNYTLDGENFLPYGLADVEILNSVKPKIMSFDVPDTVEDQVKLCSTLFGAYTNLPVRMISFGPHKEDKKYMED